MMKQMEYGWERKNVVLANGMYLGYEWVVKSLGTHPCAYVKIPKGYPSMTFDDFEREIDVHGGITFTSYSGLRIDDSGNALDGVWIGWDYAHAGDADGLFMKLKKDGLPVDAGGKCWTTKEMIADCHDVINQLYMMADRINRE